MLFDHIHCFRRCRDEHSTVLPEKQPISCIQESHREREILLALSGETSFTLNGISSTCMPGDAVFINSGVPHQSGYKNIKNDITHIWVHLHPLRFFAILYHFSAQNAPRQRQSWEFPLALLEIINARWDLALRSGEKTRTELYLSIARLIAEELRFFREQKTEVPSGEADIVNWVKKHISINCGRNSSMEELEKLTGYSRGYLMRQFKLQCGMTIGEYINTVRRSFVAAAPARMTQKEMAAHLGFNSAAAFWLWKTRDKQKKGGR